MDRETVLSSRRRIWRRQNLYGPERGGQPKTTNANQQRRALCGSSGVTETPPVAPERSRLERSWHPSLLRHGSVQSSALDDEIIDRPGGPRSPRCSKSSRALVRNHPRSVYARGAEVAGVFVGEETSDVRSYCKTAMCGRPGRTQGVTIVPLSYSVFVPCSIPVSTVLVSGGRDGHCPLNGPSPCYRIAWTRSHGGRCSSEFRSRWKRPSSSCHLASEGASRRRPTRARERIHQEERHTRSALHEALSAPEVALGLAVGNDPTNQSPYSTHRIGPRVALGRWCVTTRSAGDMCQWVDIEAHGRGTCSHHGGVAGSSAPGPSTTSTAAPSTNGGVASSHSAPAATSAPSTTPASLLSPSAKPTVSVTTAGDARCLSMSMGLLAGRLGPQCIGSKHLHHNRMAFGSGTRK